ncbi:HU family DNA-binding protein [Cereibacter sphaeroides]|uniref:HU family DNA-binding protein n=1 Tax=Cereibacter sphaeroides TaxID=1063 RepID=UPI001F18A02B|nr:HU family DNA-binding protein [Cereibacter sphaeroides]MCE6952803.1 HU family DNA-binding protein [Cereibacter sphaeroides]
MTDTTPSSVPKRAPDAPAEPAEARASVVLRKKDLIEQVAGATGVKRKEVREAVEATLVALGEALERGDELNLPPLGHLKVQRRNNLRAGIRMMVRLRRTAVKDGEKDSTQALADAGE